MADIFDQLEQQQSGGRQLPGTVATSGDIFDQLEQQQTAPPGEPSIPLTEVVSGALRNFPESTSQFAKVVAEPFTSVEGFVNTAKSIGTLAQGLVQYAIPGDHPSEKAVEAVGKMYAGRFGGLENIKRTLRDDPVGFMADLSFFLGTGGAVAAKVAGAGKVGRAAAAVGRVGKALDPVRIAGTVVSAPIKLAGKIGKQVIGNMVTGVGAETISKAFDRPPDFVKGLTGKTNMEDVLRNAKGGLSSMKDDRAIAYTAQLAKVKAASRIIDMGSIKTAMRKNLTKNYQAKIDGAGNLDLASSVFPDAVQSDVQKIYKLVNEWDATPGNTAPIGLDTLKRRLDDFFVPSKNSRAFVTGLRNEVKNKLTANVKNYAKMTKDYAEASDILNQIEKGLALGDRGSMDSAIRRLSAVMKENNEFRNSLLGKLEVAAGTDFRAQIAGIQMQKMLPQGLIGRLADVGIATNILQKGIMATDPALFAALMATSPRVMATFLNVLGKGYRGSRAVYRGAAAVTPGSFQLSRAGLKAEQSQQLAELE